MGLARPPGGGIDTQSRRRVLTKILVSHARTLYGGGQFQAAFHLVYPDGGGRFTASRMRLDLDRWLTIAEDIDRDVEGLTAALGEKNTMRELAATIEPGFAGLVLVISASFRAPSSRHLIEATQGMLVASLVTLDGRTTPARYLLDEQVAEFPDSGSEDAVPWDEDGLLQMLYLLDDALRVADGQRQARDAPVILMVESRARESRCPGRCERHP